MEQNELNLKSDQQKEKTDTRLFLVLATALAFFVNLISDYVYENLNDSLKFIKIPVIILSIILVFVSIYFIKIEIDKGLKSEKIIKRAKEISKSNN